MNSPSSENLRKWQSEALDAWIRNGRRGIVEVVTGGGKTRLALAAIRDVLDADPRCAVVVLVPTTALLDQWYVNLTADLGLNPESICLWPESKAPDKRFHIMVINTARNRLAEVREFNETLFVVADECHRYASAENSQALRIEKTYALGLTATAQRDFDDGLERHLIPSLGSIIYQYSITEARRDGVVVDFGLVNVRVHLDAGETAEMEKLSRRIGHAIARGDDQQAKHIAMRRAAIAKNAKARLPATIALANQLRGRRLIVFHEDIRSADLIAELLRRRGHRVITYHSRVGLDMRRDNLRMFKVGMVDVLVCCRALDEGIDIPEAECAILAASTSSHRQRVQRLGRVLRLHDGKGQAAIYTLYATDQEAQRLVAEMQSLDGVATTTWLEVSA